MTGFKNFLLRGNLIELAVAFIMGAAFSGVVTSFTAWITSVIPGVKHTFNDKTPGGHFGNEVIAFILISAVVYFGIVVPYTAAKARYFPEPDAVDTEELAVLKQIRDSLANR